MRERYPHPSQQPLLPLTMALSVVMGALFLRFGGQYATFGAGFAFAWFLVSFALYSLAWILRDYAEWLASRRSESPIDAE
jgi:hypothetical protein